MFSLLGVYKLESTALGGAALHSAALVSLQRVGVLKLTKSPELQGKSDVPKATDTDEGG
jgi:hypothetical protein